MAHVNKVEEIAAQLARAIEITMDANTTHPVRVEAFYACERFKEESPFCVQMGFFLASGLNYADSVRHFGMQLIEHSIKFKWNIMTPEEKLFIKNNVISMLNAGVSQKGDSGVSQQHIKDVISRCIVEMAKREWPQQWDNLLSELSEACRNGESQTEIVLMVFLRLVEDVALLQTIESNKRRKDMYQALTNNMQDIFDFLMQMVDMHVTIYREQSAHGAADSAQQHGRVVEMTLVTLSSFVEWVNIQHIVSQNGKLLELLCFLLNNIVFQCSAAECLAQITNRKGQLKDRKPLMLLYDQRLLRCIYTASQMISGEPEHNHNFLKKLLQVLNGLAQQLVALWGKDDSVVGSPTQFGIMLECMLFLAKHPSMSIAHGAALVWLLLLKHDLCSKDVTFISYIPTLINVIGRRVIKQPYVKFAYQPSLAGSGDSTPSSYIGMEFDSEEEYIVAAVRCRNDFLDVFRQTTIIQPLITFAYCQEWLHTQLRNAADSESVHNVCSIHDALYLEWDGLSYVLDAVLSRILLAAERPSVNDGLQLLKACISVPMQSPLMYSIQLSCISSLFIFLSMSNCATHLLQEVFEKIFKPLAYEFPNAEAQPQKQLIKALRRHAASLIVKLAHKYPMLLLPIFENIHDFVKNLATSQSRFVCNTLQEALLLLSNHFCDYERQLMFIQTITQPVQADCFTFAGKLDSAETFMQFVGLSKAPVEPLDADPALHSRLRLLNALMAVLAVVKRCTWPDDPDRAQRGGFIVDRTESGNPIYRNPATKHVEPLLPYVFRLVRMLNEIFTPKARALLSTGYRNVYDMLEHEKKLLMGICAIPVDPMDPDVHSVPTATSKMQTYISTLSDNCYHLLGSAGPSLGWDFYKLPGLASAFIDSAFAYINDIPDYRLRPIIRVFLKPFLSSCPSALQDQVLLPIFEHITPAMCERLQSRWAYITALYQSGQLTAEISDTEEVLEDQLNRSLTRDYLDVIKIALIGGQIGCDATAAHVGDNDVTMDMLDEPSMDGLPQTRAAQSAMLSDVINDLGGKLLRKPGIRKSMLLTIFGAIVWNDGTSSMRAVHIAAPVMRFLAAEQLFAPNEVQFAFTAILEGLKVHGQHDANLSALITLGIQFYELLHGRFAILENVLLNIPQVDAADIQRLNEKVNAAPVKGNKVDRAKKELFKKITATLIGRSLNELFRNEICLADLPPLVKRSSNRKTTAAKTSGDILLEHNENANISQLFVPQTK